MLANTVKGLHQTRLRTIYNKPNLWPATEYTHCLFFSHLLDVAFCDFITNTNWEGKSYYCRYNGTHFRNVFTGSDDKIPVICTDLLAGHWPHSQDKISSPNTEACPQREVHLLASQSGIGHAVSSLDQLQASKWL